MGKEDKIQKKENKRLKNEWNAFRNSVYETKSKSQDDFEKYINIIASGGLAITIAFFDKIVDIKIAEYIALIIIGWILLVLTLVSNLISHYISIDYSQKTINEIDNEDYDNVLNNVGKRIKIVNQINLFSIGSLIGGITFIIVFVILNVSNMNNDKPTPKPQTPKPLTEEKGRPINNPPQSKPSTNPKK
ncbi:MULTISPECIES: hypothetical protein [unclassified Flavobacterium]|uniref:hypothetical protein n=1 Tax=unclassified Flavobacterium TaxID=196869 RepID=UPI000EB5B4A1|nr:MULTISPECIES: hypothetical protein [unclassified Flavobacterium]RKS03268.1 hypothetical protein C8C84_3012 [Flavobacterium sp. 102]